MPSNLELLRQGKSIEFEPGVSGRLNPNTRKLELSTGEVLDASNDPDFFPQGKQGLEVSRHKEHLEKKAKGPAGEFFHQYTSQGIPGGISDWQSYLTQTGEQYANTKQAESQVSNRISEESPYTSAAATGANIATDLALTRGMSGLKAAPLITLGSSGSRLATEPENVAVETGLAAAGGGILDKATGWLSSVAKRRGAVRGLPAEQQAVREANAAQSEAFNSLKQNVKGSNEAKLRQHQAELNARQNKMIEAQNNFESAKSARDAEVIKLKNQAQVAKSQRSAEASRLEGEYKAAKSAAEQESKRLSDDFKRAREQYESSLNLMPQLEKQAQAEYSKGVVRNAEEISNSFPKDSKIYSSQFGINDFIENNIQKGASAGTKEANQSSRIIKSLFPEGETLSSKEIASRYKSLEGAIQKSTPEVREILNEFKTHMGDRIPSILADNMAYSRVIPSLRKEVQSQVGKVLDSLGLSEFGASSKSYLKNKANSNANQLFNDLTPQDFIKKMQNGELRQEILSKLIDPSDFSVGELKAMSLSREAMKKQGLSFHDPAQIKYDQFVNNFTTKLDKELAKAELKMIGTEFDASKRLGAKVKRTYGVAEPIAPPVEPIAPNPIAMPSPPPELPGIPPTSLPPPISSPLTPPMPAKPSLLPEPMAPTPLSEPMLPGAQGIAESAGDFLEKPILGGGGSGMMNNPLLKLGGLKYLLGNAALPAEAAYLGMKGLTSPTAAGEAARLSFKQAGIEAIEMWAQQYPSYNNGILQSPQDRRSLTKEIEDDFEIPIEQKAVLQSKVNRGKPLQQRL